VGNPNPDTTAANKARRKYAAGTTKINARVDALIWQAIEEEFEHKTLGNWSSKSEIVNYALSLVHEQASEASLRKGLVIEED